jgi:molybdenum cofactor cytidylyltransferase
MASDLASKSDRGEGHQPREPAPLRYGVVILAAGASTRLGRPKQLQPIDGQPLVVRAAEAALQSSGWPVVVVLGAEAERIRPVVAHLPVLVAENSAWAEGMASSIRTGIATLRQFSRLLDGALLALCDQPAFATATIAKLISAHEKTGRSIVASRYGGQLGAPAFFRRDHFPALAALTGEEGARPLLRDAAQVATVDLPELAQDIDDPGDLATLRPDRE